MTKSVCQNKWCKATFEHGEQEPPSECPKCRSMSDELSAGVTWTDKTYEGPRMDGMPHRERIKITNYRL